MRIIDAECTERFSMQDAGARITSEGYLVAEPRIARTGIQEYLGSEFGLKDVERVRVYRPPAEVFKRDSMRSFAHRPLTNGHPPQDVKPANWNKYAIGHTGGDVAKDGEFIRVPMMMMDGAAIKEFKAGKRELSAGYSTKIIWEPGVTDSGEQYDAVMTDIQCNHLAFVAIARGGPMLRIGDERQFSETQPEERSMTNPATRTLLVDGINVQLEEQTAAIVDRAIKQATDTITELRNTVATLTTQVKNAQDEAATAATAAKKANDEQVAKIATLEQQLKDAAITPAKLDELVADRTAVFAKAKSILGDGFKFDGKTVDDVRREAVKAKLGDAMKDWSDDQCRASFDTLTAGVTVSNGGGSAHQIARSFDAAPFTPNSADARSKAYDSYRKNISEAYKNQPPVGTA